MYWEYAYAYADDAAFIHFVAVSFYFDSLSHLNSLSFFNVLFITFDLFPTQSTDFLFISIQVLKIKLKIIWPTLCHIHANVRTLSLAHNSQAIQHHRIHYFPFFGNHCRRFVLTIRCFPRILIYFESYFVLFSLRLCLLCEISHIFQEYPSK